MKRKGNIFAGMLLLLCISMLAAIPALAYDEGDYQIEVSDIRVSGRNLKRGDRCRISMKINNKGFKKLDNVEILYRSPSTQFYAVPLKYKKSSGRWVGNFKAKDGMQKGFWKIWSIRVDYSDGYEGGGYSYYNRRGVANLSGAGGDLSKGNFRVRGTRGDYSKPEIQWDTLSVSKSSVSIRLNALNKEGTKWKGVLPIKKSMKKSTLGISKIYITGKNDRGKNIKCQIRNTRWSVESYGFTYVIDQNLSAGNVKIRS